MLAVAALLPAGLPCRAIPVTPFADTPTFVERAGDIVIAKCVKPDVGSGSYIDGLHPAEVEVTAVIKGKVEVGKLRIATVFTLKEGKPYLLASTGGRAYDTSFLAIISRSVVELPAKFDLNDLKGKTVPEQVKAAFTAAGLSETPDPPLGSPDPPEPKKR
jgi:hypothetical protein